jgi:hypothetical protein
MFRFANLDVLWNLLPVCGLFAALWYLWRRHDQALRKAFGDRMVRTLLAGYSPKTRNRKTFVAASAGLFLLFALARPQMGSHQELVPSVGLDLVFLLDVSNSMLTEDVVPSRLKKAKHVIRKFMDQLSGDRLGIVAFAGSAFPAVPLTSDYEFVNHALESIDERSVGNQGTSFAAAVRVGIDLLTRGGVNKEDTDSAANVMIVLSDGESHVGAESELKTELNKRGILVYTIGVGTSQGGPIPLRSAEGQMQGFKRDSSGTPVHTKLEPAALREMAKIGRGTYYEASADEAEVLTIVEQLRAANRSEHGGRKVTIYEELFQFPLALALVLILASVLWPSAAVMTAVFLISPYLHASSLQEYQKTEEGKKLYQAEDYSGAAARFAEAQAANPDSPRAQFNLGTALLKSSKSQEASTELERAAKGMDGIDSAKAHYNWGRALQEAGDTTGALSAYQKGLEQLMRPNSADPEVAVRIKRAMEQSSSQKQGQNEEKEKKPDQSDQKNENQNQDQNKKYQAPKPKFKGEKLDERDAKRILKQLKEQESKTRRQLMRQKSGKPDRENNGKDW